MASEKLPKSLKKGHVDKFSNCQTFLAMQKDVYVCILALAVMQYIMGLVNGLLPSLYSVKYVSSEIISSNSTELSFPPIYIFIKCMLLKCFQI